MTTATTSSTNPLPEWALYFAALGWPVFPLRPLTKRQAAVKDWEHRATTRSAAQRVGDEEPDRVPHLVEPRRQADPRVAVSYVSGGSIRWIIQLSPPVWNNT
jgi:bifunctional DNA primase/polymerase-like protein